MGKGKGWMWIGREGDIQGRRKVGTGKIERERGIQRREVEGEVKRKVGQIGKGNAGKGKVENQWKVGR